MYNVLQCKNDLSGVLHGTTNNQIQNLDGVINRAARKLLLDLDPQETKRTVEFVTPIFNTVTDYAIADDVKGNKIIDIFPQVQRLPSDIWGQAYNQAFDIEKENIFSSSNMFTMNFNTGVKTIRVNAPYLNPPVMINQAEGITVNGTWAVSGTASNLSANNSNYVTGAGSLQFDTTTGTATITNSTMTAIDLSSFVNQSSLFAWVYVPTGTSLTSVQLRWGSSSSDYYAVTVTENQQGNAFVNGWNLCQFEWSSATETGTVDDSEINYLQLNLATSANMTGCLINGIQSILGTILSYEYYSKYLFRNASTGAFQETVLDDSDLINLDTESYNLLFNLVAYFAVQQQQGRDATQFDGQFFLSLYTNDLARYKAMYKSEVQKPQTTYYAMPKNNRFYGRPFNQ